MPRKRPRPKRRPRNPCKFCGKLDYHYMRCCDKCAAKIRAREGAYVQSINDGVFDFKGNGDRCAGQSTVPFFVSGKA